MSALNRGLSFAPTCSTIDFDTFIDFQKYFRTLRLREFFHPGNYRVPIANTNATTVSAALTPVANASQANTIVNSVSLDSDVSQANTALSADTICSNKSVFRKKSTFLPSRNRNASLDTYCRLVERDVQNALKKKNEYKVHNNLSKAERESLKLLGKDTSIIIRPADKGGAVVIQNTSDYNSEIQRQLSDIIFYRKLDCDPTNQFRAIVHKKLDFWLDNKELNKNEYNFMKIEYPPVAVIYTLPKVHKSQEVPLVGRPIVSGIGSLTSNISTFIDHLLKPFVFSLPSYTRDSIDFINKLKSINVPPTCLLATLDVSSLYTNIPHDGGVEAVNYLRQIDSTEKPNLACVSKLTELVLTSNYFKFQNDY